MIHKRRFWAQNGNRATAIDRYDAVGDVVASSLVPGIRPVHVLSFLNDLGKDRIVAVVDSINIEGAPYTDVYYMGE